VEMARGFVSVKPRVPAKCRCSHPPIPTAHAGQPTRHVTERSVLILLLEINFGLSLYVGLFDMANAIAAFIVDRRNVPMGGIAPKASRADKSSSMTSFEQRLGGRQCWAYSLLAAFLRAL
jgi:hypothetical protein